MRASYPRRVQHLPAIVQPRCSGGGQKMTARKHPQTPLTMLLWIAACLPSLPLQAQYSGGRGTADDPYQIATAADLIALGNTPQDFDKHFVLTADIDLDPNLPGGQVFTGALITSPPVQAALPTEEEGYQVPGYPLHGIPGRQRP